MAVYNHVWGLLSTGASQEFWGLAKAEGIDARQLSHPAHGLSLPDCADFLLCSSLLPLGQMTQQNHMEILGLFHVY